MKPYTGDNVLETMNEYATLATYKNGPTPEQYQSGTVPLDTLPASWWNFFVGKLTKNEQRTSNALADLYQEFTDVLTKAGLTPDPNEAQMVKAISAVGGGEAKASTFTNTAPTLDMTVHGYELLVGQGTTGTITVALPDITPSMYLGTPYKGVRIVNAGRQGYMIHVYIPTNAGSIEINVGHGEFTTIAVRPAATSSGVTWVTDTHSMSISSVNDESGAFRTAGYNAQGRLTTPAPTADYHAANKKYVDDTASSVTSGAIAQEVIDRNAAIASAQLDTQTWLPSVATFTDLPDPASLPAGVNYLCRVMTDPTTSNNGVWQRIANTTEWTYFSDNLDFVDEDELTTKLAQYVPNTGDSTIAGIKTFGSHPIVPSATMWPSIPSPTQYATQAQIAANTPSVPTNMKTYTYIVDSNAKLDMMFNGPHTGNDYSRILIKAGSWSVAVTVGFDLNTRACSIIEGEDCSTSILNITLGTSFTGAIFSAPDSSSTRSIQNCTINLGSGNQYLSDVIRGRVMIAYNVTIQSMNLTESTPVGFYAINQLHKCCTKGYFAQHYYDCRNLDSCEAIGYISSSNLTQEQYGFRNCQNLVNCRCSSSNNMPAFTSGFHTCSYLYACTGSQIITTATQARASTYMFSYCTHLVGCVVLLTNAVDSNAPDMSRVAFRSCQQLTGCYAYIINTPSSYAQSSTGFQACTYLSGCYVYLQTNNEPLTVATTFLEGYNACTYLSGNAAYISVSIQSTAANASYLWCYDGCDGMVSNSARFNNLVTLNTRAAYFHSCYVLPSGTTSAAATASGGWNLTYK